MWFLGLLLILFAGAVIVGLIGYKISSWLNGGDTHKMCSSCRSIIAFNSTVCPHCGAYVGGR